MKKQYYNKWEFEQVKSLMENNPYEAKNRFEEYLKNYPKDYSAYPFYATTLITLREFDKAEEILDYVESLYIRDKNFIIYKNKVRNLERNILVDRIKILSYRRKFNELYQLYINNYNEIESMDLNHIIFYCMSKVGKLPQNPREQNSYLFRQIIEYQDNDFLEHIQKHLSNSNKTSEHPNKSIFAENFPIEEIIKEVKKYIPSNNGLCYGYYSNVYIFKYDNCGRNENRLVDYFKVICFDNTADIITMFPSLDCENLPYIDLNYLINDKKDTKVKRLTQIEKFNQRYKRN